MSSMEYLIPTDDQPPKNVEEAHHMIKFHVKIFVLLTTFQLVAILANQPFLALNIVFCLYMVSYQIWRCIVLINDHFALRAIVDLDEDEDLDGEEEQEQDGEQQDGEEEQEQDDEQDDEQEQDEDGECECKEGECQCEDGQCEDEDGECECDEEKDEAEDVDMNGNVADDEGAVAMDVVEELTDLPVNDTGADGIGTEDAVEPVQEVVAAADVPIPQSEDEEVKPRPRRRRRQD
jgi:hypothetical protein